MLLQILEFLTTSGWYVNGRQGGLLKFVDNGKTFYSAARNITQVNAENSFTHNKVIEVELDFQHQSARVWLDD